MEVRLFYNKNKKILGFIETKENISNSILLDLSEENINLLCDKNEQWVYKGNKIVGINHTINLG